MVQSTHDQRLKNKCLLFRGKISARTLLNDE